MHARRAADARQRPPQATERENFLLFVWLQDVAHGREGLHVRRRRQRLGRRQLIVGFEVSTNCRFWVSTEAHRNRGTPDADSIDMSSLPMSPLAPNTRIIVAPHTVDSPGVYPHSRGWTL